MAGHLTGEGSWFNCEEPLGHSAEVARPRSASQMEIDLHIILWRIQPRQYRSSNTMMKSLSPESARRHCRWDNVPLKISTFTTTSRTPSQQQANNGPLDCCEECNREYLLELQNHANVVGRGGLNNDPPEQIISVRLEVGNAASGAASFVACE